MGRIQPSTDGQTPHTLIYHQGTDLSCAGSLQTIEGLHFRASLLIDAVNSRLSTLHGDELTIHGRTGSANLDLPPRNRPQIALKLVVMDCHLLRNMVKESVQIFLSEPQNQKVRLLSLDPQEGPDGYPYMMLSTEGEEVTEPFLRLVQWGADKGIGLALNPQKESPDLILTHGMLWNYMERGEFFTETPVRTSLGEIRLEKDTSLFAGPPSESFWPAARRKIFKEFLLQQGVIQPKVLMISEKAEGPMDLAFSLESLGNPDPKEWNGILEAFSWFFPRHYSLLIFSEKNIKGTSFQTL